MRVQMDVVSGANVQKSLTSGTFIRCGQVFLTAGDLPATKALADSRVMLTAFTQAGVPQEGDQLSVSYSDWICVERRIQPYNATQWQIICIFRWTGALTVRDHTSLQETTSVLAPILNALHTAYEFKPAYNTWTDPNPAPSTTARTIKKLCHFRDFLPFRNLTYNKTVKFAASTAVLGARRFTNNALWKGLPAGYWLVTDVDGQSQDNFHTFTYSVTFTTQTDYDWSSLDVLQDDRGLEVNIDPVKYTTLLALPYTYGLYDNTTCPGVVKACRFATCSFPDIFGIDP